MNETRGCVLTLVYQVTLDAFAIVLYRPGLVDFGEGRHISRQA
jgi:hypothetical protein